MSEGVPVPRLSTSRNLLSGLLAAILLATAAPGYAGPFADDMAKCLVRSATTADKTVLVQWMFSFMALHPDVKQLAAVSDAQRAGLNKQMADMMVALLTERCVNETREALKNEGKGVIESSFGLLGQVAAQELFGNPAVVAGLSDFGKALDANKLKAVFGDVAVK
jgi:hypothetical protein